MYNHGMETLRAFSTEYRACFPGQLLPLHIFEPRYRQMIGECIQHGQAFGVVLIRSGAEVGETAEPYEVGTTAHIVQVESAADGRMNILCVGNARFRIVAPPTRQAVFVRPGGAVAVGTLSWKAAPMSSESAASSIGICTSWQKWQTANWMLSLPTEPAALANIAASVLQVELSEKQHLLATPSISAMLIDVADLLQRELRAWQIVQASRQLSSEEASSFSLN